MAQFPALPIFTDAILADTNHLSDEEFGVYMRLLFLIWRSPDCKIPNDENWIVRRLKTAPEIVMPLVKEFCQSTGNCITQKRLKREFEFINAKSKKNSVAAKYRWEKDFAPCERNAPTPTPTPTPTPEVEVREKIHKKENDLFFENQFNEFWAAYPKRQGKGQAERAYAVALKKTDHQTIMNGVKRYDDHHKRLGTSQQYIKQPSTWLNGKCWADELTESATHSQSTVSGQPQRRGTAYEQALQDFFINGGTPKGEMGEY